MKRLILAVAFVALFIGNVFAADDWKFKIMEVSKPSLNSINVSFVLLLNGTNYVGDQVTLMADELSGKTAIERKDILKAKVKDKCAIYIETYTVADKLNDLVNLEFSAK